jgi:protein SCO1
MNQKYLILYIGILFISACQEKTRKLPYYNSADFTPIWELPTNGSDFHSIRPFHLLDQEGKVFTEKNIENKICVVDFFFTICPGICPKMTNSMAVLQKEFLTDKNILLLSHSVTPERDSVQVLKEYAAEKSVQYDKWRLLTGTKGEIYNLGRKFVTIQPLCGWTN